MDKNNNRTIGILTFHRCINYGSYWQARCLAEGLQAKGYNAVLLDHYSARVNLAEWKCAYQPVLPTTVPESDLPLYREKIEKFFAAFESLPMSAPFPLDNPGEMPGCDTVVVGSDEVWNLFHPWYGKMPVFYGEGIPAQRLVSYAASFGNYPASWGLDGDWSEKLLNFHAISVRDENSRSIVFNAIGVDPEVVLDPCLQFQVSAEKRELNHLPDRYVAVYGHNFSEFYINQIQRWANARKLPLISIGYRNDWADVQWIAADPHEFANFIAASAAVATNFFHGCIFSIQNNKPFVSETTAYRSNKLQSLMWQLGAEDHLITEDASSDHISGILEEPVSAAIHQRIRQLRQTSNDYLDRALGLKQFQVA